MTNGCGGNVGAGKYNDGSPEIRPVLTDRVYQGMVAAWKATQRHGLKRVEWRVEPLQLRRGRRAVSRPTGCRRCWTMRNSRWAEGPGGHCLCWMKRTDAGASIDVPVLDLGAAQVLLLPGEPFVEYQLAAQKMRPDAFVMVIGTVIPVRAMCRRTRLRRGGYESGDWSFVQPGVEGAVMGVLRRGSVR